MSGYQWMPPTFSHQLTVQSSVPSPTHQGHPSGYLAYFPAPPKVLVAEGGMLGQQGGLALCLLPCLEPSRPDSCSKSQTQIPGHNVDCLEIPSISPRYQCPMCLGATKTHLPGASSEFSTDSLCLPGFCYRGWEEVRWGELQPWVSGALEAHPGKVVLGVHQGR